MTFSEKLITLRAGRGWSQERLAEELGVTRQAVGRWEKGAGLPDAVGLTRLAAVFDVAPEWLLDEAAPDKPEPRRRGRARLVRLSGACAFCTGHGGVVFRAVLDSRRRQVLCLHAAHGLLHRRPEAAGLACRRLGCVDTGRLRRANASAHGLGPPYLRHIRRAPAAGLRPLSRGLLCRRQGP